LTFRPQATPIEILWLLRAGFILVAILASSLAILDTSVYDLFVICGDVVYIVLFPQLTIVLFWPWHSGTACLAGSTLGIVLRLLGGEPRMKLPALIKYPFYNYEKDVQVFPYKTFTMLVNLVFTMLVAYGDVKIKERRRRRRDEVVGRQEYEMD